MSTDKLRDMVQQLTDQSIAKFEFVGSGADLRALSGYLITTKAINPDCYSNVKVLKLEYITDLDNDDLCNLCMAFPNVEEIDFFVEDEGVDNAKEELLSDPEFFSKIFTIFPKLIGISFTCSEDYSQDELDWAEYFINGLKT